MSVSLNTGQQPADELQAANEAADGAAVEALFQIMAQEIVVEFELMQFCTCDGV